ncbi:anhydro-N-acetylmuramic acid kinase [Aquimarina addita]|uniref:Anhydro-N-acetylmuramic acid kinase n=1 Tax=Aquimarina addita TaxID=870485 RepID=A0ABP7X742_9FLAO
MVVTPTIYKVIGLMSGTSLDGLDIAYCHFQKIGDNWSFTIPVVESIDYTAEFREKLKNTVQLDAASLLTFGNEYGIWLGKQVKKFINRHKLTIDFIASHGHTVFHQPDIGLTYQIGSGQHIASSSNQKVIADFRTKDVVLGGQGAPLVPIGDQLLFGQYDFCLNLGGISNISFQLEDKRIAYDISPVNMLLNFICKQIDLDYDHGGQLAHTGKLNPVLLNRLNELTYYKKPFPKSLGYEWFMNKVIPIINNTNDTVENLLHTSVYHITEQIANSLKETKKENSTLFITGGGAKNHFLIETLQERLSKFSKIIIPDENSIDYKEALIFAFLGVLRERNEINCLSSVTGAKKDCVSGVVFYP